MPLPVQVSNEILLRFKDDRDVAVTSFMQIFSNYANRLMICDIQATSNMEALTLGNKEKEIIVDLSERQIKLVVPKGEFWFNYVNNVGTIKLHDPEDADETVLNLVAKYAVGKEEQLPPAIREKVAALRIKGD